MGWSLWLIRIPTDTLIGHGRFFEEQYQLDALVVPDTEWSTNGLADYISILRVDTHLLADWLIRGTDPGNSWTTTWQIGDQHQYLVERRDDSGKRVISITLQPQNLGDVLQRALLPVMTLIGYLAVAIIAGLRKPYPEVALPLLLMACGSLLNLAWLTFGVPFSYIALQQPFVIQVLLHMAAMTITIGVGVHFALIFPASPKWFIYRKRLILSALYIIYPIGLVIIFASQPERIDQLTNIFSWEIQIAVAFKAIAYLIWATQYRQASLNQRAQLHWILMVITAHDLIYLAQIFSRNPIFDQLQPVFALLLPFGYGMATLLGRSLRIRIGSTAGVIHGVANTLTLALFLCGLGLVVNLLTASDQTADLPLVTVLLSAIFALTTVPLANLLRDQFDSWFQGTRSSQRALLYQFTSRVSEQITLNEVTHAFFEALDQGVQSTTIALWLWNDEANGLEQIAISDNTENRFIAVDSTLYQQLLAFQIFTPVTLFRTWEAVQAYHGFISLVMSGKLIGVCAIGERIDGRNYSADTIHYFEVLTRSATLALRNAQLVSQMEDKIIALRHAYHQVMNAQESERQRLATELHDETLQQLAHINLLLGGLHGSSNIHGSDILTHLQSVVTDTEQHLRDILRGVHPAVLTDLGLIPALQSWLPRPDNITIELKAVGFEHRRLPDPGLELTLYRLCQEALNNAIKHAHPTIIAINLEWDHSEVILEVIDNGVGFEHSALASKYQAQTGHFGLMNLYERVNALNGHLVIKSQLGYGTCIRAILPST